MWRDQDTTKQGLDALSKFFVGDGTLQDTLYRVAELATQTVGADMAGITLLVEGRPQTAIFTDPESPEIDSTQYRTGVGPCLDAFRNQKTYRIDSTDTDTTWPAFSEAAAARGVMSSLSLPLVVNGEGVGALNLYARTAGAFSEGDEASAEVFSAQASIALANAQAYWDARRLGEGLHEAMKSRAMIEQAKGILMASGGRSPDDAFQMLVRASQRENRKLSDMAADLIKRTEARLPRKSHRRESPSSASGP